MKTRRAKTGRSGSGKERQQQVLRSAQDDNSREIGDGVGVGPNVVRPATREETMPIVMGAVLLGFMALIICFTRGYVLLYGDAVAHLGIARRIFDSRDPGLAQLGGVWLPLPHMLMLPFVQKMEWWRNGLAGAWPSMACYIAGVVGFFRLCRRMLVPRWAWLATAFYGLNPNLLYLSTTAMTEPLFLALMVWMTLLTVECVDVIRAAEERVAARRMVALGVLILAAVLTRYDGWALGGVVWCVVAWELRKVRGSRDKGRGAFLIFTVLAVAGPVLWLGYNQHFYHDALDFMRGPYSAAAIERKTSPLGSEHYRGWHSPVWALVLYARAAQVDAAAWETGFAAMAAALAGLWIALRRKMERVPLLLWMPLAFYVYSIAYGSVPIFIPQLWPHSYYNSRYGLELLAALALFGGVAAAAVEASVARRCAQGGNFKDSNRSFPFGKLRVRMTNSNEGDGGEQGKVRWVYGVALGLVLVNPLAMIFGTAWVQGLARLVRRQPSSVAMEIYSLPLVLREALVNATTRMPFERDLGLALDNLPVGATILMAESDHVGALQDAGIPLLQTVNESDYYSWRAALADPASHAQYVVAFEGDDVAKAVEAHPEGLEELSILCGTGQGCARVYRSTKFEVPQGGRP